MEAIDPTLIQTLLGNSTLAGVLFVIVQKLWASKQSGDKALIDYLQSSKKDDLEAQKRQIESNDRLASAINELKDSINEKHSEDEQRFSETDRRLTAIELQLFKPLARKTAKLTT